VFDSSGGEQRFRVSTWTLIQRRGILDMRPFGIARAGVVISKVMMMVMTTE